MSEEVLIVRVAREDELKRINDAYTAFRYSGKAEPKDTVILAERGSDLVGLVRGTVEQGVQMLRGMYVAPDTQRQGVGSALLRRFVELLGEHDCYCLPYTHLTGFYGADGFQPLAPEDAPVFLATRLTEYRKDGGDTLLMKRPGTEHLNS